MLGAVGSSYINYNLPPEYQQVQWIDKQNTTSYIQLATTSAEGGAWRLKVRKTNYVTTNQLGLCYWGTGNVGRTTVYTKIANDGYIYVTKRYYGNYSKMYIGDDFDRLTFEYMRYADYGSTKEMMHAYLDGSKKPINAKLTTSINQYPGNVSTSLFKQSSAKDNAGVFEELELFSDATGTTTAYHYIPCFRKEDNWVGVYELVSGVFYPANEKVDTLIVGPNVV